MSTPLPSDWALVRDWFERAQPLDTAARQALLADAALSTALLAEVRSLLAHGDPTALGSGGDFLSQPAVPERQPEPGREGQLLGPWRIVQRLGTGGMGHVWLAERADGAYAGQAAIKVLKRGMDTATVLERFAQEQQALARMAHPHIAHLLDAGQTDDGLPYFVMERVVGQPIDSACAGLPLAARLGLFLQLAEAVAHAHRKLLVHRDLKPSNVLVTPDRQVKLLDFGIAKALDPLDDPMDQPLDGGGITLAGERPFTPLYASPEQIRGEAVGTATDIYSLGVLLYVMLTGVRPYGRQATSPREAARSVLEEQPSRPSALNLEPGADADGLDLRQRLKGDLDNILLKALAKDIDKRYASVDALADDVRAYLGGYPVSAQPPKAAYLVRKFVQRNRWPVAAASAALLALVGGLAGTAWQAHRAEQRLAQLRDVTRDVVLRYGDAVTFLPGGLVVKENLLKTLLTNLDRLEQEAGGDPEWLGLLAGAYARLAQIQGDDTGASLDKMPDARSNAERAIALALRAEAARPADPALVASHALALQMRAQGLRAQGKPEEGLKDLDDALARLGRALAAAPRLAAPAAARGGAGSAATATAAAAQRALRVQQASVQLVRAQFHDQQTVASLSQPETALTLYEEAAQALRQLDAEQADPEVAALLGTLHGARAITHARMNRLDLSQADADLAFRQRLRSVQAEPFNTAWRDGLVNDATNAAVILLRADRPGPALEASQAAWTEVQALARESGPQSKWIGTLPRVAQHHGRALVANGRYAEALPVLQTALAFWDQTRASKPGAHPNRMHAWLTIYLARALQGAGDPRLARQRLVESVAVLTPLAALPKGRDAQLNLGEACLLLADLEPAQRATWRQRALQAYATAQALLPLTGDHLRNYTALGGKA